MYPLNQMYKANEDINFSYHIMNKTGFLVSNISTSCEFHLYNQKSTEIFEDNLKFKSTDFYIDVNKSLFNTIGEYSWYLNCNGTKGAGFVFSNFEIIQENQDYESNYLLLLGVIAICAFLIFIAFNLDATHVILKFGLILLTLFILKIIPAITAIGNGMTGIGFLKIYNRTLIVIIVWFVIYFTWEGVFRPFAEKKNWIKKRK